MLFLITNIAVEVVLGSAWWLVRKIIYGLSSYLLGLVYTKENKFYIDEKKWNELVDQNKLQKQEITQLRQLVEKWVDDKSTAQNNNNDNIDNELVNYLAESFIEINQTS